MIIRQSKISIRQLMFPIENGIVHLSPTWPFTDLFPRAQLSQTLFAHARSRRISNELPITFIALFDEYIAVQFCEIRSWNP
ncbi:Protein of unknown function [Cotesia congregata]|uniref:Uncharacterized protein n=1 Tax=Cotesia congregata TaxID=51543 RepID=A0A8J2HFF2_COTCN|nr:Protein of unknown function [Cotesia congregata]